MKREKEQDRQDLAGSKMKKNKIGKTSLEMRHGPVCPTCPVSLGPYFLTP